MNKKNQIVAIKMALAILFFTPVKSVNANFSSQHLYDEEIKKIRTMTPLDEKTFGDEFSLQDGTLVFKQTDVSIPTKNGGRIEFGRISESRTTFPGFASGWAMNVPYMVGTYDTRTGWNVAGAGSRRCSTGKFAPQTQNLLFYKNSRNLATGASTETISDTNIVSPAHVFWHGIEINIPSAGNEQLLEINSSQVVPLDENTYHGTTKSGWRVGCIDNISGADGEGFTVLLPDGSRYYFNLMVKKSARNFIEYSNSTWLSNPNYSYRLNLANYFLLATKSIDRFGNTIIYDYNPEVPGRLRSISSSDGARIDITHDAAGSVSEVSVGNRRWKYEYIRLYSDANNYINTYLQSIELPDGSNWKFSGAHTSTFGTGFDALETWKTTISNFWDDNMGARCKLSTQRLGQAKPQGAQERTIAMTHPSGAKGEFTVQNQLHGMNAAPGTCYLFGPANPFVLSFGPPTSTYILGVPSTYLAISLVRKKISGPGINGELQWDYSYNSSWSFDHECTSASTCDNKSITTVSSNDGKVRRYEIGNNYRTNLGQIISTTIENDGQIAESSSFSYATSPTGQAYPSNSGNIPLGTGVASMYGNPFVYEHRPMTSILTIRDGVTFTSQNTHFDSFARPTSTKRHSSLGHSRTDVTEYDDNLSLWVLGQIKRTYNAETGLIFSQTEYDIKAMPWKIYSFGRLQRTFTYHNDGTLATETDGNGNTIAFSDWKRGIPQLIRHPATPEAPDGATESATVNDSGWITSVTDEIGSVTGYGYDAMGRLASIVQPTGDALALPSSGGHYYNTIRNFRALTASDWKPAGILDGQWRLYEETGTRVSITYMDALWRPILKHEFDAQNTAATLRASKTRYDSSGRVSFQSYPSSEVTPGDTGTRTFYDALDRVKRVEQDSEHGVLVTTTQYISGLKTLVTNPKGFSTTTSFMAWDQPTYDFPILSEQPEGKVIQIDRHPHFGWPLSLTQRNSTNTLSATRRYVYQANGLLCKTIEPEIGATVYGYDHAGNLTKTAAGLQGFDDINACNHAEAWASGRAVDRVYDARNRLTHLNFPNGGQGNQIWTYEKDNLPASVTTYNHENNTAPVVTTYSYNKRRLLVGETLAQPGWYSWSVGYAYDGYGHLSTQTYPTGLVVDYAPNPLGQPTKAGIYASGAQYYPNGALKQFTYGNGIVHTMTQNARQLPERTTSSNSVLDFHNFYDANGNVEHIANLLVEGYDPRDRWMQYDQLDRLTAAGSGSFGGDHWHRMTYDALDNLKSWKLAGVKDYADYVYDAQNRLTMIRNTAGATVVGIEYDAQGNVRNKNGQIHDFDYGNRLRAVMNKEAYRYDGLGRRVMNWRPPAAATPNGSLSFSLYTQSGQIVYEEDYHSSPTTAKEHVYLAGSIIATRENKWGVSQEVKYQHTDALGSPVAVTNALGQVIERMDYEPWGAIIGKPNHNGIGYTGHVMDGATGLTYMQQRYYDQSIGRFLSVDPVTAHEQPGQNFNRYWYSNNNPYRFVDPDGRKAGDLFGRHEVDLGPNFVGRLDRVPNSDMYEIHVYKRGEGLDDAVSNRDAKGLRKQEVGVAGPDGNWIKKHGHTSAPTLTLTADNKLRSRLAQEARLRGWLAPQGQADIKGSKLGTHIRAGIKRSGALSHLLDLGKSLGPASVVVGYFENLSTEKAEALQPGFLESLNE